MSEVYTVIDIETTGLDHETDQIIEIAAVKYREDGTEIGRFHTLVALYSRSDVPQNIAELTGITTEDLDGVTSAYAAIHALEHFVCDTTIIAHNAPFDLAFLSEWNLRHVKYAGFICTRALSRIAEPEESPSLANVCARHGIELNGHHRAMNDAEATWKVFEIMREKLAGRFDYKNVVLDLPERPLKYVPRGAKVVRDIGYLVYDTDYPEEGSTNVDIDELDTTNMTVLFTVIMLDGVWMGTKGEAVIVVE